MAYFTRYSGDPYWTTARFQSSCRHCGRTIKKGEDIFYYPKQKAVYCQDAGCGQSESDRFTAEAQDEDVLNGRG